MARIDRILDVLPHLYALRVQIAGCFLQWPLWGWALQTPLARGLADIGNAQVAMVSQLAALQSVFLAITTITVLLWGPARRDGGRVRVQIGPSPLLNLRRFVCLTSLLFWGAFMNSVHTRSTASHFWLVAIANLVVILSVVVVLEEFGYIFWRRRIVYRLFLLPVPGLWDDSFRLTRPLRPLAQPLRPSRVYFTWRALLRARRWIAKYADRPLGPGFLDYRGTRPWSFLPGHFLILVLWLVSFWLVEDYGLQFLYSGSLPFRYRLAQPSTLSMVLSGALFVICLLTFLAFWADRYRLPVSLLVLGLLTVSTWIVPGDHVFWSEPAKPSQLAKALTPGEVLDLTPRKFVVVAAAGGGIQASAWTAQVLSSLEEEFGADLKRGIRVMSGVSGGAIGLVYYLGTYDGVWGKAYSPEEARVRAMASFLDAVAWGIVYPDLHNRFVPIPALPWRDADRGWALERSLAQRSGRYPGPTLLSLGPLVRSGLPVVLLNSTLTSEALPVVFTNSRFPGPETTHDGRRTTHGGRRGIRSFHDDFNLDTRLETAARLSASFPFVSPAARPSELKGRDAFVDGGYFDNSGLYSLMGWLEQAALTIPSSAPRDVLLLQIDAFPEPQDLARQRAEFPWYRQLTLPFETVIGVRETGQAARNRYDFPLLAKSIEGKLNVHVLEFRFRPSRRCGLERPPLSWHLTRFEQGCVVEGWDSPNIVEARRSVGQWLQNRE